MEARRTPIGWLVFLLCSARTDCIALQLRPQLRTYSRAAADCRRASVVAEEGLDLGRRAKDWWSGVAEFALAFIPPKLENDDLPEAVAFSAALADASELGGLAAIGQLPHLANLSSTYYKASFDRVLERPAVKNGLPDFFVAINGVIVLLVLRLLLPRVLAIQSMNDLYEFAPELGLPTREELLGYVQYAESMDIVTKLLLFLVVIVVEKVRRTRRHALHTPPAYYKAMHLPQLLSLTADNNILYALSNCAGHAHRRVPSIRDRPPSHLSIVIWWGAARHLHLCRMCSHRLQRQLPPRAGQPSPPLSLYMATTPLP